MHVLNIGKHFKWLANPQSCQWSHGCGSGLWWAAGLQEDPEGSAFSSASRNKEGKMSEHFQQGFCCSVSATPCLPQHRLQAPLWDPCGDTLMAPGSTCKENQWNIAHQSFWKTAVSHLKPESCEKSFFLWERMMMLRVCLNAVSCLSPVNSSTEPQALLMYGWAQHSQNPRRRFPMTVTTRSQHKSTLMNLMPSYPNKHQFVVLNPNQFLWFISWEKRIQTKQQTFNKTDLPNCKLLQLLCYNTSLAEAITLVFFYLFHLHILNSCIN